jgi:hypothetical protein
MRGTWRVARMGEIENAYRFGLKIVKEEKGRAMAQAVSRWPPTSETRVRSQVSPCGICGGQSGTGTALFPEYFGFPLSISFHRCSITWKSEKN